ncbi:UDP-3-O-acyl-N-acetylglucosamine deacetylase [Kribbella sandramycini]
MADAVRLNGRGLHSGRPVRVVIHPGTDGIAFRYNGTRIPATPDAVTSTDRSTTLGGIATVEHLMSAFAGLEITDAEVELSAPELPALDGSAAGFVTGLTSKHQLEPTDHPAPRELFLEDGDAWIRVTPGTGRWSYTFNAQTFTCSLPTDYVTQVAPARTIALTHEVAALQARGLGQGLDLGAVVLLDAETGGYGNEPRYPDEPARHKLLDLIGDLALSGVPARRLDVTAYRTGHRIGTRVAALLRPGRAPGGEGRGRASRG